MARIIPSILLSDIRGKAGTAVFSAWKGRPYVRRHVIPANPNSVDQQKQRAYMRAAVAWWHDLEQQVKDHCGILAQTDQVSGFNAFTQRNVKDMYDEVDTRLMPLNAETNPIADDLDGTPGASGVIALSWSSGEAVAANKVYVLTGINGEYVMADNLTLFQKDTTAVSAHALNVTGLTPGQAYALWLMVEEIATHKFSIARFCEASAGA